MRRFLPLIALFLAACNADKPQSSGDEATTENAAVEGTVQDKANADVEAAMAEAR